MQADLYITGRNPRGAMLAQKATPAPFTHCACEPWCGLTLGPSPGPGEKYVGEHGRKLKYQRAKAKKGKA